MKIVFLCSSLEPGRDGVGDYTRRLCGELIRQGHQASIIALHDRHLDQTSQESSQYDGSQEMQVLRISSYLAWKDKVIEASSFINSVDPEWISLQYVPYGFNRKGLPFQLASNLKKLSQGRMWHVMFHETWVGIKKESPFTHLLYKFFQIRIAKNILMSLEPRLIMTTNIVYHRALKDNGISSEIVPLFSNIAVNNLDEEFINKVYKNINVVTRASCMIVGLFGGINKSHSLYKVLNIQYNLALKLNKRLILIIFGRSNIETKELKKIFANKITFLCLGELSEQKISTLLQIVDKGISCTPIEFLGKSGVYAAMRLHNLPVIIPFSINIHKYEEEAIAYAEYLNNKSSSEWNVEYVSTKMYEYFSMHTNL